MGVPTIIIKLFNTNNFIKNPNKGGKLPNDMNINMNINLEKLSSPSIWNNDVLLLMLVENIIPNNKIE